ncbi:MAG: glycine cleavage system aminomethyltransferase GcvT [Gammaproteobacteria bacterium]|nr:glycine cleavage system aminomethyltransferase GcvT [Gammaproteobacteria bacterium]
MNQTPAQRTPLYSLHVELDAKMTSFGGYCLPVSYPTGIIKEHLHTRSKAGLFDISHMGQICLSGQHIDDELETLVPGNLSDLNNNSLRYTVLTNQSGGIIDDLIISRINNQWILVVNASNKYQVYEYICRHIADNIQTELLNQECMLALQGPAAATVMQSFVSDGLDDIAFMTVRAVELADIPCRLSRCGYTGEDGFEISVHRGQVQQLASLLLNHPDVLPIGLGARDTLRLEAGLCLYGQDIDTSTTPEEAGLSWVIDRNYLKNNGKRPKFPGHRLILEHIQNGTERQRIGLIASGRISVRAGTELYDDHEKLAGVVTSGGYAPSLGKPIAMAYVKQDYTETGSVLVAKTRGRAIETQVTPMPFVSHRYYRS